MYRRLHLLYRLFQAHVWEKRGSLMRWFWLLLGYAVAQVGMQALNFISGLAIIRSLTKDDYALYTLVMTMGPVITILSDVGIGTGLGAIGRKIWQDNDRMGSLVRTGLTMRRRFAIFSFILVGPILFGLLLHNHATIITGLLLVPMVFFGTWCQLTSGIMRMVVQLRQQISVLRDVGIITTVVRFVLIILFAYVFFINAILAVLIGAVGYALDAFLLMRHVKPQVAWAAAPDPEYRKSVFSVVWKMAPLNIYYCIQSQVGIWLISIFGSAHQVADIGAVGRIGQIFLLIGSLYSIILVPRFARNNGRRKLRIQYFLILASQIAIISIIVVLVYLFPGPLVWLLGPKYSSLGYLIWIVVLANGIGAFLGLTVGMNFSKGWIPPASISIPLEIVTQIVLIMSLDLSKTINVLIFMCLSPIPPIIFTFIFTMWHFKREPE